MTGWLLSTLGVLVGMWLLTKSADWFVDGAVGLAHRLRMPPLIVGFVIVGFGTSAPEMLVSALAAAQGMPVLSLGNAYGSNITNILLILGVSMLVAPICLHRTALRRDIPFLLLTIALSMALSLNGQFSRADGAVLLIVFAAFLTWQIGSACVCACRDCTPRQEHTLMPLGRALTLTFLGLGALLGASQLLVCAAKWIAMRSAELAGLSPSATQLIVGLTVVATGTSLPELMASVSAMRKGHHDIALGNVVGSNCFNLCIVAGLALVIHPVKPGELPDALRFRDVYVMLGTTLLLWLAGLAVWWRVHRLGRKRSITLGRPVGVLFLVLWVAYTLWVLFGTRA